MIDLLKLPFSLSSQQGKRIELSNISAVGFPREGVTLFGKRIRGRHSPPRKKKNLKKNPKTLNLKMACCEMNVHSSFLIRTVSARPSPRFVRRCVHAYVFKTDA